MKVLASNCHGLACASTIRVLRALIKSLRSDILFLSKTKVTATRFQPLLFGMGFSDWLDVPPVGTSGGIYLTWKVGIDLELVNLNCNVISCMGHSDSSNTPWMLSCVYASHTAQRCSVFWSDLSSLGKSFGGLGFCLVILIMCWSNYQFGGANIRERLDRGLANQSCSPTL
jgi:hypothetical protein